MHLSCDSARWAEIPAIILAKKDGSSVYVVMHVVVEAPTYQKSAARAGLTEVERTDIVTLVAGDPTAGDLMEGTGGAHKLRIAGRGKGKSGGYRVITFYAADDVPIFLLDLYGKGEKANLTKAERPACHSFDAGR